MNMPEKVESWKGPPYYYMTGYGIPLEDPVTSYEEPDDDDDDNDDGDDGDGDLKAYNDIIFLAF